MEKDSATGWKSERRRPAIPDPESARAARLTSAQSGPIVGNQNRIAGIGGVVLNAGGLPGDETFEANLALETRDVLCRVIRHAGNRVAVGDKMTRAHVHERPGAHAKQTLACCPRFRRVLD